MTYLKWEELGIAEPDYLNINIPAILRSAGVIPQNRDAAGFASVYVGVSPHRGKWYAVWKQDGRRITGHEWADERDAAIERARARGFLYLERRDGEHEPL